VHVAYDLDARLICCKTNHTNAQQPYKLTAASIWMPSSSAAPCT
jgi:hypothetical protein